MLFSSLTFLFYFLPAVLFAYYLLPASARNYVLLVFSLLFYTWGGIGPTVLLILSVTINFFIARQVGSTRPTARKWLFAGIIFNISLLVVFKYTGFIARNIGLLLGFSQKQAAIDIVLPLGISFYTFHQVSMLRDIYSDKALPRVTFANTALYVTFFPQLIAGPIVRYKDIIYQIRGRRSVPEQVTSGIQRLIIGLFKKIVIANGCAAIADGIIDHQFVGISSATAWLGIIAYTLQIYYDFSGYSDMAIGLARMFGFNLLENFHQPYASASIKEFWRRWHISLSTWFRDYVYIPLGGNQKGKARTYVNLFIVFALTGLWHGASWSFLFWGIYHGTFLVIERLGFDKVLEKIPRPLSWSYTILVVIIGWVFFRIEHFGSAIHYLTRLFDGRTYGTTRFLAQLSNEKIGILLIGIVFSIVPLRKWTESVHPQKLVPAIGADVLKTVVYLLLFVYSVMVLNSGSYSPFIYANF